MPMILGLMRFMSEFLPHARGEYCRLGRNEKGKK
jgi:hypothetical protein